MLRNLLLISFLVFIIIIRIEAKQKGINKKIYCSVCETVVDEIENEIQNTKDTHTVQVGWRVDEKKRIPYARTEYRIIEIIENVIPFKFSLYGVHSIPREILLSSLSSPESYSNLPSTVYRLVKTTGKTGRRFKEQYLVNVTISDKYVEQMKSIYDFMVDEYFDEIIAFFHKSESNIKHKLCVDLTKACKVLLPAYIQDPNAEEIENTMQPPPSDPAPPSEHTPSQQTGPSSSDPSPPASSDPSPSPSSPSSSDPSPSSSDTPILSPPQTPPLPKVDL